MTIHHETSLYIEPDDTGPPVVAVAASTMKPGRRILTLDTLTIYADTTTLRAILTDALAQLDTADTEDTAPWGPTE